MSPSIPLACTRDGLCVRDERAIADCRIAQTSSTSLSNLPHSSPERGMRFGGSYWDDLRARKTVECCYMLDVNQLSEKGCLRPGCSSACQWIVGNEVTSKWAVYYQEDRRTERAKR
jgi:hypothetical protein